MPIHNWKTPFWKLLHEPDEPLVLEDIFENLKHFAVCGGLLYVAKMIPETSVWTQGSALFLKGLAWGLGALCFLQAWALTQKGFYQFWPIWHMDFERKPALAWFKTLCLVLIPIIFATVTINVVNHYVFAAKP